MFVEEKAKGEVKELDAASKLLLKAADIIEEKGHCKGEPCDTKGRFCLYGALGKAAGFHLVYGPEVTPDVYIAAARIARVVGCKPVEWNNALERTKEEVVALMRAVALNG